MIENGKKNNTAEKLYADADKAFRNGIFNDALENYREIIKNYPDSHLYPDSLYKSASVLMIK